MSFDLGVSIADNPIFGAVASHLGMDGLLGAASATPAPPPPPKPGATPVEGAKTSREFRHSAPLARATAAKGGRESTPGGLGLNMPGVMSPDVLQHPAVQALLSQYGVSPEQATQVAQSANPNLFVQNPEAFEKHPVLSNLVERGLEGLAFTKGSNTIGEGLSNVAQGVLNSNAARADKYNNQLMMPFAQAEQVAGLQNIANEQKFRQAQALRDQALVQHYARMDDIRGQMADVAQQNADTRAQLNKMQMQDKLRNTLSRTPLDVQGLKDFQDAMAEAGGDLGKVDQAKLDDIIARNAERNKARDVQTKKDVASIAGGARIKSTQINAATKPGPLSKRYETQYNAAVKARDNFSKQLATEGMAVDSDGNTVIAYSSDVAKAMAKYNAAITSADAEWKQAQGGSELPGMQVPEQRLVQPKKKLTYNPVTGKIE